MKLSMMTKWRILCPGGIHGIQRALKAEEAGEWAVVGWEAASRGGLAKGREESAFAPRAATKNHI